jgi:hypothetical protein
MHDSSQLTGLVAVCLIFGLPIVVLLGYFGHAAWKTWLELSLKQEMVARGFTAQDIIDVMAVKPSSATDAPLRPVPPTPVNQPVH